MMKEIKLGDTIIVEGEELVVTCVDVRRTAEARSTTIHALDPLAAQQLQQEERVKRQHCGLIEKMIPVAEQHLREHHEGEDKA